MKNLLTAALGTLLFLPQILFSQTGTLNGTLYKMESGNKEYLPLAKVIDMEEGKFALSDDNGKFALTLKEGTHHVIVRFVGLLTDTIEVNIKSGEVTNMEIQM